MRPSIRVFLPLSLTTIILPDGDTQRTRDDERVERLIRDNYAVRVDRYRIAMIGASSTVLRKKQSGNPGPSVIQRVRAGGRSRAR